MMANTHDYENQPWDIHPGSQRFECGSPNMLGIHAWSASLSLLLEIGMKQIEANIHTHSAYLMDKITDIDNLELLNDRSAPLKSGIVLFKHKNIDNLTLYKQLQDKGVVCALRGGGIRFSPHFYHSQTELEQAISIIQAIH